MRAFLVAAMCSLCIAANANPISGQGTWETTLQARDLDGDLVVDAYYDTTLNITWLANASRFIGSFSDANLWAANLNVEGISGWRLPTLANYVASSCNQPGAPDSSELQHMFFTTLGNQTSCGGGVSALSNTGPFSNIYFYHWSNTANIDFPSAGLDFITYQGVQSSHDGSVPMAAWAVRDGDVLAVPEPESLALFGIALASLGLTRRKAKQA